MRIAIIFILALSIHLLCAEEKKIIAVESISLVERARPSLMRILGEKWTVKILGNVYGLPGDEIPMPKIPKIVFNAKAMDVYNKKNEKIILKKEVEQKFNYAFINELYETTRLTKPSEEDVRQFMNVLSQGGTREGIYRSLVLDATYAKLENTNRPAKKVATDYIVYFYEKYLNKKIENKKIEGMNVFVLKRLMTEKVLEISDAYGENREDLEKWYAIMSADFAKRFPQIWPNKMRQKTSALEHKAWAHNVPLQHIKSEMIIKIHAALNSMP